MKKRIFGGMAFLSALAAAALVLGWMAAASGFPLVWLCVTAAGVLALLLPVGSAVASRIVRGVQRPLEELAERPETSQSGREYPECSPLLEKIRERQRALRRQIEVLTEDRDALRIITGNMQKELERQQQEFCSNIDRLRSPLATLSGLGDRIEAEEPFSEGAKELGEEVVQEASRMSALLDDMIRLSRLDGKRPDMAKVSLTAVCRETLTSLSLMAHRRSISLKLTGPEVWAKGDAEMLGELMTSLCENAIRYDHPGGSVLVETGSGPDSGTVWVTVKDTGIGIPEDSFQRIFDRFYQAEGRPQQIPGTGLGLAIAKRLADLHQGGITVESTLGEGSVFTVTLPVWSEAPPKGAPDLGKEPVATGRSL